MEINSHRIMEGSAIIMYLEVRSVGLLTNRVQYYYTIKPYLMI